MAEGAYGRMGAARGYALVFGIAYLGVAILELYFPLNDPLTAGNVVVLERTLLQNSLHWVIGIVLVGSYFSGEAAARASARIIGVVLLALAIWGFVSPTSLGRVLGYDGGIPVVYNVFHAASGAVGVLAGFATTGARRRATARP